MATYTSNYAWTKPSGGDPVDIEVLNDNLDDQDSIVHQAFLDLAPVFSTANTYAVKDVVLYDNKIWICHTAVTTAGAWTGSANWTQTTVGETGGVATYADLPDKPSINGNELSGNKTGAQLGLQNVLTFDNVPTANSNNPVKSDGVYSSDEAIRKWTTAEAKSASGNPITLADGSARKAEGLVVTLEPKQSGSGTPSPENVRPITGYTECVVDRDGRNLYSGENQSFRSWKEVNISLKAGTYTISAITTTTAENRPKIIFYNGATDIGSVYLPAGTRANATITLSQDVTSVKFQAGETTSSASGKDATVTDIQFEIGDTPTPYVPYSHDTITFTFGETVYEVIVDAKTGVGTVTKVNIDLGALTWTRATTSATDVYRMYANLSENLAKTLTSADVPNAICELYKAITGHATYARNTGFFISNNQVLIYDPDYNTYDSPTAFKTAMDGVHLCYELATPIEIQLTPAELELLKGYNYITSNGTTIALAYLPDSLLAEAENYVDAKIPPAPTTDGTYVLTCTVTSGAPAYTWESAT